MGAILAEGEAGVERLFGVDEGAAVGEVFDLSRQRVFDGERLLVVRLDGPITRVDRDHVATIGRDGHGHGQVVELLGMAGDFADQLFACGQVTVCA